jgi:ABC-2 type transport system permease protein
MRNVALITRRELASYIRTPSGYIIAGVTLLVWGLFYNGWAMRPGERLSTAVLEDFLWLSGFFSAILAVLFTMRLLAEDRSNGTQVLLFTSPVREVEVVLGKYIASLAFILIVLALSAYMPALIFVNGKVSLGHIAAGYLGMALIGATALALGMVASALAPHPFLAVLLAAGFVGMLEVAWWVAQLSDGAMPSIVGAVSPIYGHYLFSFRKGIVQLSDLAFFGTIIYFSLLASTRVLKGQRWR